MSSKKESSIYRIIHEKDLPGDSADDISGSLSGNLSDDLADNLSDSLSDSLADSLADRLSDDLSDSLADSLSDSHSGHVSGSCPACFPEMVSGSEDSPEKSVFLSGASGRSGNDPEKSDVIYQKISRVFREHGIPGTEEEAISLLKEYYDDESVDEFVSSLSGEDPDDRFSILRRELAEVYLDDRKYLNALILLTHIGHGSETAEYDFLTGVASYYFAYDPEYSCPGHTERYLKKAQQAFTQCLKGRPGKEKEKKCRQYIERIREEIGL